MKLRILMVAFVTALGPGCASIDKSRAALRVDPVVTVRHGAPDTQSYYQLARYHHGQQRLRQAEAAYLKAIDISGNNVNALNALASLYAERRQLDKAVQTFEKALLIAPDAGYIHNNLGYAYYLQGRQEQAYAAVRKALSIDPGLARGWSNLLQIVTMGPDLSLSEVVAARRLDALPMTMQLAVKSSPPLTKVGDPGVSKVRQAAENALLVQVGAYPDAFAAVEVLEPQASRGKFVLVSPDGETVLQAKQAAFETATYAGPPVSAKPHSQQAFAHDVTINLSKLRLEVSNGNGITGFAKRFVAILRSKKLPVQRITNNDSFVLAQTLVEFQPGYESVARALISRARLDASLVPAKSAHPAWNVRILLGKDAVEMAELHSRRTG